jgi:transcriptional regulator with XRE-family HTH domain
MTIDDLRAKLKHMNLASVARATGLTRRQVEGVANGTTRRPDYDVVKTLIEFFEGE